MVATGNKAMMLFPCDTSNCLSCEVYCGCGFQAAKYVTSYQCLLRELARENASCQVIKAMRSL